MQYFLVKSEPDTYSYDQLEKDGSTPWSGVRNYAARNTLRLMTPGDKVLYYHSQEGREVVAEALVGSLPYPDKTATDGKDWTAVDIKPVRRFKTPVTLTQVKEHPDLQETGLVKLSRLSVMPLSKEEYKLITKLGGL